MNYIIMLIIVIGLALADIATGFIKAYCTDTVNSAKMRKGGLNKIGELIVMCVAIGIDVGANRLGVYYDHEELSELAGLITASAVFAYITCMESVSILENYAAINPNAAWIEKIIKKLKANDKEK